MNDTERKDEWQQKPLSVGERLFYLSAMAYVCWACLIAGPLMIWRWVSP